jgi:Bacterial CdiA-CT RNAse A domain
MSINTNGSFLQFNKLPILAINPQTAYKTSDNNQKLKSKNDFPVVGTVTVKTSKGESPESVAKRALLKMTSIAGLDGTQQQKDFVEKNSKSGLIWADKSVDITPNDGTKLTINDIKAKNQTIDLSNLVNEVKQLQKEFVAQGGKLSRGKDYTLPQSSENSDNPNDAISGKDGVNERNNQKAKLEQLMKNAQVLNSVFGEPAKLTDLKHFNVKELNISGYSNEDNALASLIEEKYGKGNLWADKKTEILQIAKSMGVKVENLKSNGNGTASFDLNVENVLKLQHAYIGVQEKFNIDKANADEAIANHPIQKFAQGVVDGAWEDLKSNWKMVTSPWQTVKDVASGAWELGKLGAQLAAMPSLQRNAMFAQLAAAGFENLADMPVSEAAYKLGKFVGMAAVEIALFKGAGAVAGTGLKALNAIRGTEFGKTLLSSAVNMAKEVKQTVGNIPIPTGVKPAITLSTGQTIGFPTLEMAKLGDVSSEMLSKAKQIFSSGGKLIDEAIIKAAKEKVEKLVKNGDAQELKAFLKETYQKHGYQLYNELKETVAKTIDETYGIRKTIDLDEILGGHAIEKHVGKSDNWLRKRLLTEGIPSASTFRNKEVANRTVAQFVKENRAEIEAWLNNPKSDSIFQKSIKMSEPVGNVLEKGKGNAPNSKSFQTDRAWIVIVKDSYAAQGWRVETAFPIPKGKFSY